MLECCARLLAAQPIAGSAMLQYRNQWLILQCLDITPDGWRDA
jgi:hypothetical protein